MFAVGDTAFGLASGALTSGNAYLQATRWDGTAANYNLLLQPNGGSVGIGVTPSEKLHVSGNLYVAGGDIYIDTAKMISTSNTNPLRFGVGSSEKAQIDGSGRLLVGTSSTSAASTIIAQANSSSSTGAGILYLQRGQAAASISSGETLGIIDFADNAGNIYAQVYGQTDAAGGSGDYPGRLVFATTADGASSSTERMVINRNGLVLTKNGLNVGGDRGAAYGISMPDWRTYNSTSNQYVIDNYSVGVKLDNGATSWSTVSDERQKTNLILIEQGLTKVSTLRAVTGRYLTDDEDVSRSFLIAQDVKAVLPEAVSQESDEDGTLSLRYTEVIPLLVAALKESKERIEKLEAKVAALEA
jgi:hypothetical protein